MLKRYFRSVFGIPSRSSHDRYVRNTSTSLLMKSTEPPRRQGFAFAPSAQYSATPATKRSRSLLSPNCSHARRRKASRRSVARRRLVSATRRRASSLSRTRRCIAIGGGVTSATQGLIEPLDAPVLAAISGIVSPAREVADIRAAARPFAERDGSPAAGE